MKTKHKQERLDAHPYLCGNFAPVHKVQSLTTCTVAGDIPPSLAGGQYVRNGANPFLNEEQDRACHWFDGDGMLTGVLFRRTEKGLRAEFVNNWIDTDVHKFSKASRMADAQSKTWIPRLTRPITPSIATLINPMLGFWTIITEFLRTLFIVLISHITSSSTHIWKISVANTAILYHDGRALATCESGPPMRIGLPELETIGWFNGNRVEGEPVDDTANATPQFPGTLQMTTAHPKVDERTGEMVMFHNTFSAPFVRYTVLPASGASTKHNQVVSGRVVPGITSAKLMHDFGVSERHTVILDVPLSVDPFNLVKGRPMVQYNPNEPCRFGVFPRHRPEEVVWYEDTACMITHTATMWDEYENGQLTAVCMIACRMTDPSMIWGAANLEPPKFSQRQRGPRLAVEEEEELLDEKGRLSRLLDEESATEAFNAAEDHNCRLHYYRFPLQTKGSLPTPSHSFALSAIDMEFPTVAPGRGLQNARFIYGCSSSTTSINAAHKSAIKIDIITKVDAWTLVRRGRQKSLHGSEAADPRSIDDVLRQQGDDSNPVQLFRMPPGVYAGEPRFVPNGGPAEDDGHLLFFTFDEAQLLPNGEAPEDAVSELWILDAKNMTEVVAKIRLVQRVPYGLHGDWFTESQIRSQRPWGRDEKRDFT